MRHLRLVYSAPAEERMKRSRRRVYPPKLKCFRCRVEFTGDAARTVMENDGACDPCAEYMDAFPQASEQGHQKKEET